MSTAPVPDDQYLGGLLLAALAFCWLLAPLSVHVSRRIVTTARINAIHRRQRAAYRTARATTTHWLGSEQLTRADFDAIARRDRDRADAQQQPDGAA